MTVNFANLPAATLLLVCDFLEGDGHTVWRTEPLQKLLPQEYVEEVTNKFESDTGHYKTTIFKNGEVVPETTGVYGLSLYRRIARDLGLPGSEMGGRGFAARDLDRRIREHLQEVNAEA